MSLSQPGFDLAFHARQARLAIRRRINALRYDARELWLHMRYNTVTAWAVVEWARYRKARELLADDCAMALFRLRQRLNPTPLERLAKAARAFRDASKSRTVSHSSALSAASHVVTCQLVHGWNAGGALKHPLGKFAAAVEVYSRQVGGTPTAENEKVQAMLRVVFRALSPADMSAGMVA